MNGQTAPVQAIEDKMAMNALDSILFEFALDDNGDPIVDVLVIGASKQHLFSDCSFETFSQALEAVEKGLKGK